jgi:hypothetical protein
VDGAHHLIQGLTSTRVQLGRLSGVDVFSSIHHHYGRHPPALLACTLQPLNPCSDDPWCHLMILVEFRIFEIQSFKFQSGTQVVLEVDDKCVRMGMRNISI